MTGKLCMCIYKCMHHFMHVKNYDDDEEKGKEERTVDGWKEDLPDSDSTCHAIHLYFLSTRGFILHHSSFPISF